MTTETQDRDALRKACVRRGLELEMVGDKYRIHGLSLDFATIAEAKAAIASYPTEASLITELRAKVRAA